MNSQKETLWTSIYKPNLMLQWKSWVVDLIGQTYENQRYEASSEKLIAREIKST